MDCPYMVKVTISETILRDDGNEYYDFRPLESWLKEQGITRYRCKHGRTKINDDHNLVVPILCESKDDAVLIRLRWG